MIPGQWGDRDSLYFFRFVPGHPPRPIRLVTMAGIIVFLSHYRKFSRFLIDDGSGTARCLIWANEAGTDTNASKLRLGDFIEVSGPLEWHDKTPAIIVKSHVVMNQDPNQELFWWMDLALTFKAGYSQKYNVKITPETERELTQSFEASQRRQTQQQQSGS